MSVTVSEASKVAFTLSEEMIELRKKAQELNFKQDKLLEEFFIKMKQVSDEHQRVLLKMGSLQDTMDQLIKKTK